MNKLISLRTALGLSAIFCLGMATPCMAKTPGCGYNVTSIVYDSDSQVPPQPYQYQSDGLGPYTTFKSGQNSVTSEISRDCSWALDSSGSTTRGIVVTLAYPYSGSTAPPFTGRQEIHGNFHTSGVSFGTMTFVGQTVTARMHLVFTYNGVVYNLALAPPAWSGTSYMQVTCTGGDGRAVQSVDGSAGPQHVCCQPDYEPALRNC